MSTRTSPAGATAGSPIDAVRWPDVATVPACSAVRAAVARRIVRHAFHRLPLRVRMGQDPVLGTGGPELRVDDPASFERRIATGGLIGFGESYMAGEWDSGDLVGVMTVLARHVSTLVPPPLQRLRRLWAVAQPAAHRNTPDGARANVHHHYDLSNELFAEFLDETMTYSSAVFGRLPADPAQLVPAQHHKIDRLLDLAGVGPGTRLLEIGTGWGELAIRAARRGARVRSLTLSDEQRELARLRIEESGFADRADVQLCDYREARGSYDAIVSVEMIEAVGAEFWPVYFTALDRLLAPGGRVALQAITLPHDRMLATRDTHTWIQKYIFPGGMIPSVRAMDEITRSHTRLRIARRDAFGPHYAETLRLWRERFAEGDARVDGLGFDTTFRRMWTLYLAYSEAGFAAGYLDVEQILFTEAGSTEADRFPARAAGRTDEGGGSR
ncbi:class I SAM-dependent methyltransferase [Streptomyces sp. NPDC047108]|uniref:class I SAM-dependent methyltransferase n=1 Tax=Streptomyces sp. NPDC047108 TaxID=3155025 RepID=UPI0033D8C5A6